MRVFLSSIRFDETPPGNRTSPAGFFLSVSLDPERDCVAVGADDLQLIDGDDFDDEARSASSLVLAADRDIYKTSMAA